MGFIILLTQSVLPIFIILGIANFYYRKFKPDIAQLVNVSLYVFVPSVVFHSMVREKIGILELGKYLLLMVLVTAALMLVGHIGGKMLRLSKSNVTLFMLSVSMINIGNFGVPLIFFTYGDAGTNPSILTFVAFNLPLVTIAIYLSSNESTMKGALKDVMRIPIFHASVVAIIINSLAIPVPDTILKLTGFLGQAAFPFVIFILGLQLATIKLNPGIMKVAMTSVIIRLGVSPFIAAAFLHLLSFEGLPYSVTMVQIAGPSALMPLMYAIKFGKNADLLAAAILLSTALSALTLPLVIYLVG
ncbi:MAG: AEC family transporter [Deferribacterales bacterium]